MYTAGITSERLWLTLASAPDGDAIVCGSNQTSAIDVPLDGEVRHYAGNRTQAVVRDQDDLTLPLTLRHLSITQLSLLRTWRGKIVLVRTMEGERFFAVYFNCAYKRVLFTTPDDDPTDIVTYDADISLQRVSYNEAV
jgi:hypothetical protein